MSRTINTDVWLSDVPEDHRELHYYHKAVYVNSATKIEIICKIHNTSFWQMPYSHKNGSGCPICNKSGGKTVKCTQDEFVAKSIAADGEAYGHELVKYKNSSTKVDLICSKPGHGVFSMTPNNRLAGQHCPICARETRAKKSVKTNDQFLQECLQMNYERLTFDKVVYAGDKVKVTITCKEHDDFDMWPSNFLQGQGCPKCAKFGYNAKRPGYLYLMGTDSISGIAKVGITNRSPETRAKEITKSSGEKFHVICHAYYKDGKVAQRAEKETHRWLSDRYEQPPRAFDGSTECFNEVNYAELITFLFNLPPSSPQPTQLS
jgi:hypothetical protein